MREADLLTRARSACRPCLVGDGRGHGRRDLAV